LGTRAAEAHEASEVGHQTREQLERADRLAAIGTLAAGIVHDIRNPLVSVRTFLQLLPERRDDEEFCTAFRELALSELDRVCVLINDLLSFSRPTDPVREVLDLAPIAEQMVRLLEPEARKGDVHLHVEMPDVPLRVAADEGQLRQLLMNVVLNAIEATPPGGHVVVNGAPPTSNGSHSCTLRIRDTGEGVPDGEADRLFEPFYTTKPLGSGLGLYVARRIVDDHAGTIEAAANPEGGTCVSIRLPCVDDDDAGG